MKKTSIYIDDEIDIALSRQAAALGTTKAEVIRQALASAAGDFIRVRPRAQGVFAGPGDLGACADGHLRSSGFGQP